MPHLRHPAIAIFLRKKFVLALFLVVGIAGHKNILYAQTDQVFVKAEAAFENKNYSRAARLYGNCIEISAFDPELYFYRGMSFYNIQDTTKACVDFKFASKLGNGPALIFYKAVCDSLFNEDELEVSGSLFPPTDYGDSSKLNINQRLPSFPGGQDLLRSYIDSRAISDTTFHDGLIKTSLLAALEINPDGSIGKIDLINLHDKYYKLAVQGGFRKMILEKSKLEDYPGVKNMLEAMPKWIPSYKNGVAVTSQYLLPIINGNYFSKKARQFYNDGLIALDNSNYKLAKDLFSSTLSILINDPDALFKRGVCNLSIADTTAACEDWSKVYFAGFIQGDSSLNRYCNKLAILNGDTIDISSDEVQDEKVYKIVEVPPKFPGGEIKLFEYFQRNIKYPLSALTRLITGRVYVSFVVNHLGYVENVKILRGIGGGCDEEALRVVSAMPRWMPGRLNKRQVNAEYTVPISFTIK